jgi:hypothetical protein
MIAAVASAGGGGGGAGAAARELTVRRRARKESFIGESTGDGSEIPELILV